MFEPRQTPPPRRRKCRRPRYVSELAALRYARVVLGEPGRTAYVCSNHDRVTYHLRPLAIAKVVDTPTSDGA